MKKLIEEQREQLIDRTLMLIRDALIYIRDFAKKNNLMFNFYIDEKKQVQPTWRLFSSIEEVEDNTFLTYFNNELPVPSDYGYGNIEEMDFFDCCFDKCVDVAITNFLNDERS